MVVSTSVPDLVSPRDVLVPKHTERTALRSLGHIPVENVLIGDAGLLESADGTGAASATGTNDDHAGKTAGRLNTLLDSLLDVGNQSILVGVALDAGEGLAVVELPSPHLEGKGGTGETSMEAESSHTATVLINQELEVKKSAATAGESGKNVLPTGLLLVCVVSSQQ